MARFFYIIFDPRIAARVFFYTKEVRMQTMPSDQFQDKKQLLSKLHELFMQKHARQVYRRLKLLRL